MSSPDSLGSYPGAVSLSRVDITISRGVTPNVGLVEILAQDFQPLQPGPLILTFGGQQYELPDLLPNVGHLRRRKINQQWFWSFEVWDHRWRWWNTDPISGEYNVRKPDGSIDEDTRRTPAELAELLLEALGETGFDTSQTPTGVWPYVKWDNALPVLALAALCERVSCEVCGGEVAEVAICPLGIGDDLPSGGVQTHAPYRTVSARSPGKVTVLCGPTVYQTKLKLQAVVNDGGQIKKLSDASDVPSGGWASENPFTLPSFTSSNNLSNYLESLYRWFAVLSQEDGSLAPPGCPAEVNLVSQLQLRAVRLDSVEDTSGRYRTLPAYLEGKWWPYSDDGQTLTSTTRFSGDFTIDADKRIVVLPFPLFGTTSSGTFAEPTLSLVTSYTVNDPDGNPAGLRAENLVGGPGGALVIRRPEIFDSVDEVGGTNTTDRAQAEADRYAEIFAQRYESTVFDDREWKELVPLTTDGKIAQVRFQCSVRQVFTTRASTGEEFDTTTRSREQKRRDELVAYLKERAGL